MPMHSAGQWFPSSPTLPPVLALHIPGMCDQIITDKCLTCAEQKLPVRKKTLFPDTKRQPRGRSRVKPGMREVRPGEGIRRELLCQAAVHQLLQGRFVQVLADEHDLLHAVSVLGIPVLTELAVAFHHLLKFFLLHGGEPEAAVLEGLLLARLLKEEAFVNIVGEIAQALGADNVCRPFGGHHVVELVQVQGRTAGVHISVNAVLQGFPFGLFLLAFALDGGNPGGRCSHSLSIGLRIIDFSVLSGYLANVP